MNEEIIDGIRTKLLFRLDRARKEVDLHVTVALKMGIVCVGLTLLATLFFSHIWIFCFGFVGAILLFFDLFFICINLLMYNYFSKALSSIDDLEYTLKVTKKFLEKVEEIEKGESS